MKLKNLKEVVLDIFAIVGFVFQWIEIIPTIIRQIMLCASFICIITLLCFLIYKRENVKRKTMIKMGKNILNSTINKAVLFGGDLSWYDDYKSVILDLLENNKEVEIFIPKSKIFNTNRYASDILIEKIDKLAQQGVLFYMSENDYHLRGFIIDPDNSANINRMKALFSDRIHTCANNTQKNIYRVDSIDYETNKEVCKTIIHLYYLIKQNSTLI